MQMMQTFDRARWLLLVTILLSAIVLPWLVVGDELAELARESADALAGRPWLVMGLVIALLALDPLLPVPSSIVAVAAGGVLGAGIGALAIWSGLMAGAILGFWIGRRPGRALASRLVGKAELGRFGPSLRPVGPLALLVSRPVPVVAEAVVIFAGTTLLPWRTFLIVMIPANAALAVAWAGLGAVSSAGNMIPAIVGMITLPAFAYAAWHLLRRA